MLISMVRFAVYLLSYRFPRVCKEYCCDDIFMGHMSINIQPAVSRNWRHFCYQMSSFVRCNCS